MVPSSTVPLHSHSLVNIASRLLRRAEKKTGRNENTKYYLQVQSAFIHCSGLISSLRVSNVCCAWRHPAQQKKRDEEQKNCGVIYAFAPDAAGTILCSYLHGVSASACNNDQKKYSNRTKIKQHVRNWHQVPNATQSAHPHAHTYTDTVSALSLDKSRRKKVHVSNVIYAFEWRRSWLTLAQTKLKCNFAVDYHMCLRNFWTFWCAATVSFGKIDFSHRTQLRSKSIRRTNASNSFFAWSRKSLQRLRSIDRTFGHHVIARVLFHLLPMFESKLSTVCSMCFFFSSSPSSHHPFIAIHFNHWFDTPHKTHFTIGETREWTDRTCARLCYRISMLASICWCSSSWKGTRTNLRRKICCKLNQLMSFVCALALGCGQSVVWSFRVARRRHRMVCYWK